MRCIDCAHYPWVPTANPGMMPPMRCHPELEARRWTEESKKLDLRCPHFAGIGEDPGQTEVAVMEIPSGDNAGASGFVSPDDFTAKQLRAMADEYGIKYKASATKKELARLINDHLKG
jgi:hypothetical protein